MPTRAPRVPSRTSATFRRAPTGAASRFVRESAVVEAERCRTAVESALPDASAELYFNLGPAGRHAFGTVPSSALPPRAAWVVGPRTQPLHVAKETRACDVVTVRLHPWVTQRALGVPATDLRGAMVDLDVFWGSVVADVRDRLHAARDPAERLAIVEHAVEQEAERRAAAVDLTSVRPLHASRANDTAPSTSPDGRYVAFNSDRDGEGDLYVLDTRFDKVARLTTGLRVRSQPGWSRDGRRLLFSGSGTGVDEVYVIRVDGSGLTRLTHRIDGVR